MLRAKNSAKTDLVFLFYSGLKPGATIVPYPLGLTHQPGRRACPAALGQAGVYFR